MSRLKRVLPWLLLGLAFVLFGVWVRMQCPASLYCGKDTEIYSFDFLGYAYTVSDFRYLGYGRFRHPLWGWLTAPLTLFGSKFLMLGEWPFWGFLLVVFASVGVLGVWLLRRLLLTFAGISAAEATVATCLFLSFAHVWLLAGLPETFGPSMTLALLTLCWALGSSARRQRNSITILGETVTEARLGAQLDRIGWILLAVLTGGVTITQAAKTGIAYALTFGKWMRPLMWVALAFAGGAALVVLVFYLRVRVRLILYSDAPGMESAWHSLVDHIAPLATGWGERAWRIWVFFSEPIILRGENFDVRVISRGYDSCLQPALLAVLYALAGVSAWLNRKAPVVRMLAAMFLVDVAIHFVIGWGLGEAQLYGGHWMYGVPILIGFLFPRVSGRLRRPLMCAVLVLAASIFLCNVHGYFCHDVAVVETSA